MKLDGVRSCVVFGPGEGRYEVWFIEHCAGNTARLTAVEPDHESADRLRTRLGQRLPAVDSRVVETDIQSWTGH